MERGHVSQETLDWERMFHNQRESTEPRAHQIKLFGHALTEREMVMSRIRACERLADNGEFPLIY